MGLTPERHLGKSIKDMQGHLVKMHEKYGLNICGEGGEYESFTLDCPLFKKKIVMYVIIKFNLILPWKACIYFISCIFLVMMTKL